MQMLSFYQIRKFIVISSPFFSCKWIYTPSLVILHKKEKKKRKKELKSMSNLSCSGRPCKYK